MKYRKVQIKDVLVVVWRLLIFVAIEILTAIWLINIGMIFWWWVVLVVLMVWIVNWHCKYFGYECAKCGCKQQINFWKEFWTINLINKKYLKCEKCKKWSRAKILVAKR